MKKSVACIAFLNNKVLIAHRNPTGQMGSRFEFPGGKVDEGESEEQAVKREMAEEFGIEVTVMEKITTGHFSHNGKASSLEVYLIKVSHDGMTEKYKLTEHTDYRWVNIDDIPTDNFVDSDLSVYPEVKEYLKTLQEKNR